VNSDARQRRRIARLVSKLTGTADWHRTRALLHRYPELTSEAAEDRMTALAERAGQDGDPDTAAMYRFHQELISRSRLTGVDEAVAGLRADAEQVPDLVDEGSSAYRRFVAAGSGADLAAAVALFEQAAALAGSWHPDRSAVLNNLGLALYDRSRGVGSPHPEADLDRSIAVLEEAAVAAAGDADGRSAPLANLGTALLDRRRPHDLERAAEVLAEAARLAAEVPAERARRLNNLGIALSECHQQTARTDQLDSAIAAYEEAVALTEPDSPDLLARLANLGTGLAERYVLRGEPGDLDRAIDLMARAVTTTPGDSGDLADWLDNLGLLLRDRYLRDGDLADLDAAVARLATAVSLTPPDTPASAGRLDQYAATLRMRAVRHGDPAELRRAVGMHREAARLAGETGAEHAGIVNNLGGTLRAWARYEDASDDAARQAESRQALAAAIEAYRTALSEVQAAGRGGVLTNLGAALLDRYERTGDSADLDAAIGALDEAVRVTHPDSPELPARLNNLANGLRCRYQRDGGAADAEAAAAAYRRGQRRGLEVATEAALRAGLNWGDWSADRRDWAQAHEAYGSARVAAERLLGQHVARRDVEAWLSAVGDLSAQAAYARCRTDEPGAAAQWLEWGRARVLSDALARARLATLAATRPDLAGRFREAAARLNAWDRDSRLGVRR
jgi:tetratricopeptide (TPR) repeat protein